MAQIDCFVALVEVIIPLVYSHLILLTFMHDHLHHHLAFIIQRIVFFIIFSTLFQVHKWGMAGLHGEESGH